MSKKTSNDKGAKRRADDPMEGTSKDFAKKAKINIAKQPNKNNTKQQKIDVFLKPCDLQPTVAPKLVPVLKPVDIGPKPERVETFASREFVKHSNITSILKKHLDNHNMWELKKERLCAYANESLIRYQENPGNLRISGLKFDSGFNEWKVWTLHANPQITSESKFREYYYHRKIGNKTCWIDMSKNNILLKFEKHIFNADVRDGKANKDKAEKSYFTDLTKRAKRRYNKKHGEQSSTADRKKCRKDIIEKAIVEPMPEPDSELVQIQKLSLEEFISQTNVTDCYANHYEDIDVTTQNDNCFNSQYYYKSIYETVKHTKCIEDTFVRLKKRNDRQIEVVAPSVERCDQSICEMAQPNLPDVDTDRLPLPRIKDVRLQNEHSLGVSEVLADDSVTSQKPLLTISTFLRNSNAYTIMVNLISHGLLKIEYVALKYYKNFLAQRPIGATLDHGFSRDDYDISTSLQLTDNEILSDFRQYVKKMIMDAETQEFVCFATKHEMVSQAMQHDLNDSDVNCIGSQPQDVIEIDDDIEGAPPDVLFDEMLRGLGETKGTREPLTTIQLPSSKSNSALQDMVLTQKPNSTRTVPSTAVTQTTKNGNKKIQYEEDTPESDEFVPFSQDINLLNCDNSFFISAEVNRCFAIPSSEPPKNKTPPTTSTTTHRRPYNTVQQFYQPSKELLTVLNLQSVTYTNRKRPHFLMDRLKVSFYLNQFSVSKISVHDNDFQMLLNLSQREWNALLRLFNYFKCFNYEQRKQTELIPTDFTSRRNILQNLLELYFRTLPCITVGKSIVFSSSLMYIEDAIRVEKTDEMVTSEGNVALKIDPMILANMKQAKARLCKYKFK